MDITHRVQDAVRSIGASTGVVHVFIPHTTAGVTVNEGADPSVTQDILAVLSRLVPRDAGYRHLEGNADAHMKASLMGSHVALPLEGGALRLGTWQSVYLTEFDGPRNRKVRVIVTPDVDR